MSCDQTIRRVTIAAALLVAAAACASDVPSPAQPLLAPVSTVSRDRASALQQQLDHGSPNGSAGGRRAPTANPEPVSCAPHRVVVSRGLFGPGGGTLLFGASRLIIPGGALHDTVTISATLLGDGTSTVDFEPQGLHFFKPAGLVLDGSGCSLPSDGSASVVYLDDAGDILETIPAYYDPHWKTVAAPIVHFSGYAIAF